MKRQGLAERLWIADAIFIAEGLDERSESLREAVLRSSRVASCTRLHLRRRLNRSK